MLRYGRVAPRPDPVSVSGFGGRARGELLVAGGLLLAGLAVISLPAAWAPALGGWVRDGHGQPILPALTLGVGIACLAAALWGALRAVTGTPMERPGTAILALLAAAAFGGVLRAVLQLADLHHFYLARGGAASAIEIPTTYWGVTLLCVAGVAFALPLVVAIANVLPHRFGPEPYLRAVRALSIRRHYLLLPVLAIAMIAVICAVLPASLAANLGYSEPSPGGARAVVQLGVLNAFAWRAFARLAVLPLLLGMWAGMEFARAADAIGKTWATPRVDFRLLVALAALAAAAIVWLERAPLLVPAVAGLAGLVAVASAGGLVRIVAIPELATLGRRWGLAEEWRNAAPIGAVLLILALPALAPLCVSLWNGLKGPFLLPADASGYVRFWREFGPEPIGAPSTGGVFGHGFTLIAKYAIGGIVLVTLGSFLLRLTGERPLGDLRRVLRVLAPIAAVAVALIPIVHAADHPTAAFLLGIGALPAFLAMDRSPSRDTEIGRLVVSAVLLTGWACVLWTSALVPPAVVLAGLVIWRFGLRAGSLNDGADETRFRRCAGYAALALLGLGMIVLGHQGRGSLMPSSQLAAVTDRIAVAVVAPLFLVHYKARRVLEETR